MSTENITALIQITNKLKQKDLKKKLKILGEKDKMELDALLSKMALKELTIEGNIFSLLDVSLFSSLPFDFF
jgi:hypothetical protein